jgi:uncharacterized protein (DUF1499 family)
MVSMRADQEVREERKETSSPGGPFFLLTPAGFLLAVFAAAAGMLSGFGTRWGWWQFTSGFLILKGAAYCGAAAAAVSIAGAIMTRPGRSRRGFSLPVAGIIIGLAVAGVPWSWMHKARELPRIHDITTDTKNPPRFTALLPLRKNAANSAEYGGNKIAALQRAAYPGVKPLLLPVPQAQAFNRALATAHGMGWVIVDANPGDGRIEATDTTFWFGFTDDIVVRITAAPGGSRVDARSESRVGLSDIGTNAARIRSFLNKLEHTK